MRPDKNKENIKIKRVILCVLVLFIYFLLITNTLTIESDTKISNIQSVKTGLESISVKQAEYSFTGLFIKTVIGLLIIIVIIFVISRFLWRGRRIFERKSNIIKQHYIYPLGTNKYLLLVEFSEKLLLLGVTENSINCLTEITEKDKIDNIKLELSRSEKKGSFTSIFREETENNKGMVDKKIDESLIDRIRRLKER
ncbi:MAG: flagellar biosynthetic protein FliO [Candidatus Hydrogenedentota bacterium]